jgi:hypothetical protein
MSFNGTPDRLPGAESQAKVIKLRPFPFFILFFSALGSPDNISPCDMEPQAMINCNYV